MLVGLILRGVSFDFRVKARAARKGMWNALFAAGSLMAAMAQGWMLGSYLTGFDRGAWSLAFSRRASRSRCPPPTPCSVPAGSS
jgi:cytochrome d ubiquinol oxidase subunit II